ncbi:MAG: hypothetical protein EXR50_04140 [Dehalococcoidia bacterium]|nr:hypothetical protein [Dehalococcoidia bacterium]
MLLLFLFSALSLFNRSQDILQAGGLDRLISPFAFNVVSWEATALLGKGVQRLSWPVQSGLINEAQGEQKVLRYEELRRDIASLRTQIALLPTSEAGAEERSRLSEQLVSELKERKELTGSVEMLISDRISNALSSAGLHSCLPLGSGICGVLPPLSFDLTRPPSVFITSPREKVSLSKLEVLRPGLVDPEIDSLESKAEELGWSALVEPTGGYSTFPTIIPEDGPLDFVLSTVAHEWTHTYLFFRPLGRSYFSSVEMRSINETVADLIGVEIGKIALDFYRADETANSSQGSGRGVVGIPKKWEALDFNFRTEMRETRLNVDSLLAEGKIEQAERYMEQQRLFLAEHGYYIRKLNQAYFAFHGMYADSPGAVSPIGGYLRKLRDQSKSLKDFVSTVENVSSYQDLLNLVGAN